MNKDCPHHETGVHGDLSKPVSERILDRNQKLPMIPCGVFLCVPVLAGERGDRWAVPRWRSMNEGAEAKEKVKATAAVVGGEVGRAGLRINASRLEQKGGCP